MRHAFFLNRNGRRMGLGETGSRQSAWKQYVGDWEVRREDKLLSGCVKNKK